MFGGFAEGIAEGEQLGRPEVEGRRDRGELGLLRVTLLLVAGWLVG